MHDRTPTPDVQSWLCQQNPLRIEALNDPVVEAFGHDPRSDYAETYWLPVLGPSALWTLRRVAAWLDAHPEGFPVPLAPLAGELGLGGGTLRNAPLIRTLTRLVVFDMAAIRGDVLAVRRALPPLARRHLSRLPGHLAERHRSDVEPQATGA